MTYPTLLPLSTAPTTATRGRTTRQTLHILSFIHRFRLVTARHVQHSLSHTFITSTHSQLQLLRAKGLIDRQYTATDQAASRPASYFLTLAGLELLKAHGALHRYRRVRSLESDKTASVARRMHYHTLTDVYIHFKRHYNGQFQFFTAFDLAPLDCLPDETPDGYVRIQLPDTGDQHYFIEIYGWGRSSQTQRRRLYSYLQFAESERWPSNGTALPSVFLITASSNAQDRASSQLRLGRSESLADDLPIYTTISSKLDTDQTAIWRPV